MADPIPQKDENIIIRTMRGDLEELNNPHPKKEKESILREAAKNSLKLLSSKEEEIKMVQGKKIMDFREKTKLIKEEKLAEGKTLAKKLIAKSEKNISKTVEYVLNRFDEMM